MIKTILLTTSILSFASTEATGTAQYSTCNTDSCVSYAKKLKDTFNPSNTCDDIFNSVCEDWLKKTSIPENKKSIGQISLLTDNVRKQIKEILEAADQPDDSVELKHARTVFKMCIDQENRDSDGLAPLNKIIMESGGWPMILPTETEDVDTWQEASKAYHHLGIQSGLFDISMELNDENGDEYMIYVLEPSFILPRNAFVYREEYNKSLNAYHKIIKEIASALAEDRGVSISDETLENDVTNIINMQTIISNITASFAERMDVLKQFKHVTISELQTMYDEGGPKTDIAHIDFLDIIRNQFSRTGYQIDANQEIIVYGHEYFTKLANALNNFPSRTVVNAIHLTPILRLAAYTTSEMGDLLFQVQKILLGIEEKEAQWTSCLELPNFEHAVAFKYAKDHFRPSAKDKVLAIMSDMTDVVSTEIREAQWLDDATKELAIDKLNAIIPMVGYPDWYSDKAISNYYKHLKFEAPFFLDTAIKLKMFQRDKELLKLREPAKRDEFFWMPYEVQASYDILKNTIVLTAAILQAPVFDEDFPDCLNYGSLGYILGHEISHGYDNIGRLFDKYGRPKNWWSSETLAEYEKRMECFTEQYNKYIVHDVLPLNKTIYVNGELTLGENIGDSVGIRSAWNTWQMHKNIVSDPLKTDVRLPGLENITADQLFFINIVLMTCNKVRPVAELNSKDIIHPPWHTRVVGSMSNTFAFSETFDCPEGSGMNPVEKCSLWR